MFNQLRFVFSLLFAFILTAISAPSYAALNLILTQGISGAMPIAVIPFEGQETRDLDAADNIAAIINHDLQYSGRFTPLANAKMPALPHRSSEINAEQWQPLKIDNMVVGKVVPVGGNNYRINFELIDVLKNGAPLLNEQLTVPFNQLRAAAHHISDLIYETLTGQKGVFSTKIAYVLVQPKTAKAARYSLIVADADGYNPKPILISSQPIMSPAWSHDGKRIAYVSFENQRAQIFISQIATGARTLITNYPGINGAPAWSPDDKYLALVLSKSGSPKIYSINLATKDLQQVTQGTSIDTEPNWAPDGKSLLFTSDRGGAPQIYQVILNNGQIQRVTYNGTYNARASFSADGQKIVMIHRDGNSGFNIGLQDLQSGAYLVLTNSGYDQSPSFAPNGEMVIYANRSTTRSILGLVSTDGRVKLRIPANEGDIQEPAWSYFK